MSNFNFENFVQSNESKDGSLSLSADQVHALLAGYKEIAPQSQAPATTGDANSVLNAGLQSTDSLYASNCAYKPTDNGPAQQPTQQPVDQTTPQTTQQPVDQTTQQPTDQSAQQSTRPAVDPFRPYQGAGVQVGAERAFDRGDRAFASEVGALNNAGQHILDLTSPGQSPADIHSYKQEILHELHHARNADSNGRERFRNGAIRLGDNNVGNSTAIDAGRGELRNITDLNLAIRAVQHNDFDSALGLISNRIHKVKDGVQTVRDGVNFGFLDTGV